MIHVGDVLWLFSGTIRDPKMKMHVCVNVGDGIFLRINTKSHFSGSFLLRQQDHPFLKWDSYLECGGPVEFDQSEIDDCLDRPDNLAGQLSDDVMTQLSSHIMALEQLTIKEKEMFSRNIKAECARRSIHAEP